MIKVIKKNNRDVEAFTPDKIVAAVSKAQKQIGFTSPTSLGVGIADGVTYKLNAKGVTEVAVVTLHEMVENELMQQGYYDVARAYITYRKAHMPDIFRKREHYRPYEYPELASFVEAINHSYWVFSHYNYTSDVQDLKVNMPEADVGIAKRAILAISQIEVAVKRFWGKLGDTLPKPELEEVGATFAESEVRHAQAYSNLLDVMGLNEEFIEVVKEPVIKRRIKYLQGATAHVTDNKDYFHNIILFSLFIENVSLFSQFYILLKYHKDHKWLKGTSNAILSTSKEEDLHAKFGFALVNTIKAEHPEWWDKDLVSDITAKATEALEAELAVVAWIVGDNHELYREVVGFVHYRMWLSMEAIGVPWAKPEDTLTYEWFDVLLNARAAVDFFDLKDPAYSKGKSFDEDDLF